MAMTGALGRKLSHKILFLQARLTDFKRFYKGMGKRNALIKLVATLSTNY